MILVGPERLTTLGRLVLETAPDCANVLGEFERDAIAGLVPSTPQGVSRALGRLRDLGLVEQTPAGPTRWTLTRAGMQLIDQLAGSRRCRSCGCTDHVGCDEGCWWIEDDVCSSCEASP